MKYLDLFCGAGGLSLGFSQAGWECVGAVDSWDDAVRTYRRNFPKHSVLLGDIAKFNPGYFGLRVGNVDWVIGGPPCQGFSTVGKREREDPRNALVCHFSRSSRIVPLGFLVENVVGLRDMKFVVDVRRLFERMGYHVDVAVLRSADFGVPQLRHRIFFVGRNDGRGFRFPKPQREPDQHVSVWDAYWRPSGPTQGARRSHTIVEHLRLTNGKCGGAPRNFRGTKPVLIQRVLCGRYRLFPMAATGVLFRRAINPRAGFITLTPDCIALCRR